MGAPRAPERAHRGAARAVRDEQRDGAVEAKGGVVEIFKHVQIVQPVRLCNK